MGLVGIVDFCGCKSTCSVEGGGRGFKSKLMGC